ncbi:MAG: aspartyl protease family protein [Acidobacteriaceae bacterium]|nr:aspartyl protease family protein [Acidobacteriaceae bacterium]
MLSSKRYSDADAFYRKALEADKSSLEDRYGLVNALIGEDKTEEALQEAEAMTKLTPEPALAEVALSEAEYRAGSPNEAEAHARKALSLSPCEGRALYALASVYEIWGYNHRAGMLIHSAHSVRPKDELILREWIFMLPRKERLAALEQYMQGTNTINQGDRSSYQNSLDHMKAHHAGECRVTSVSDEVKTPLAPIYGDNSHPVAYGLDVYFNNKRRRMQIDTGASGITLTSSAARSLNLTPEFQHGITGVGDEGKANAYLTHVDKIRIGDVEISNCLVDVVEKSRLDVDGLIGMDVFDRWLVTLDYQQGQLLLNPLPKRPEDPAKPTLDDDAAETSSNLHDPYIAPEMQNFNSIIRIGHQIMLPSAFNNKGPVHYLILDTGAQQSNVSLQMGKELGKLSSSPMEFVGLSGRVQKVYETKDASLRTANLLLPQQSYYCYDTTHLSHSNGFETSGLLGLPTLQRLKIQIDYRDNLIKLTYDPNHDTMKF